MSERPLFPGLAFSTSWNWRGSESGERIADEILGLGFRAVELNYRITRRMVDEILPYVERGELEVASVHNVFPAVDDPRFDTDSRMLGWRDPSLRARAVELAVASAEAGRELGAKALVVHPGVAPHDETGAGLSCRDGFAYDEELKRRWREGGPDSTAYRELFDEFRSYRRRGMAQELARIRQSLEEIAEALARRGNAIAIGLENRPMCFQVPDLEEMGYLLDGLEGARIGIWFDTGHGAIMRHMGFYDDREMAKRFFARLVGVHIHDVRGVDDHFAPYLGEGLDPYLDLIRAAPIKVLELGPKNEREDVLEGTRRLSAALGALGALGALQ
ncbi:MAG: TIM barrel protein [Spirochaetaceae bacterium]|nr:TIM barrel protein [Spirochaetaceae bacterium]